MAHGAPSTTAPTFSFLSKSRRKPKLLSSWLKSGYSLISHFLCVILGWLLSSDPLKCHFDESSPTRPYCSSVVPG